MSNKVDETNGVLEVTKPQNSEEFINITTSITHILHGIFESARAISESSRYSGADMDEIKTLMEKANQI